MRILVMGGTEFVSRSISEYFISKNYIVDIFTRGEKEVTYSGVNIHHIGNRKSLESIYLLRDILYDFVIDISAYTLEDVKLITSNIDTTNLKRYLFCSSGAVYEPSDEIMNEEFKRGKNHNWLQYGLDKLNAENYLFEIHKSKSFPMTIFRPTYLYGPNNNLYRESYFFDCISNNKKIPYPISSNKTQFIHIYDLVRMIESMMKNELSDGEAYNVTNETEYSFEEILDVFSKVTDRKVAAVPVNVTDFQVARTYFPYRDVIYLLSIEKLKRHNIYLPKYDLFEGLAQTYEWYKNNRPKLSDQNMIQIDEIIEYYEK